MEHLTHNPPTCAVIPEEVLKDQRLGPVDKLMLGIIPYLPKDSDGNYVIKASQLTFYLGVSTKTAIKSIENLGLAGYLDIRQKSEGRGGGFRVFFKNAAVLASMFLILGIGPALHKSNYNGKEGNRSEISFEDSHRISIIKRRKRRKGLAKGEKNVDNEAVEKERFQREQHEWFLSIKKGAQHPLGQLRPANGTGTAAPGGTP